MLESLDRQITAARLAIKVFIVNAREIEMPAHDCQKAGELRKDQRLVSFFRNLAQPWHQYIKLRVRLGFSANHVAIPGIFFSKSPGMEKFRTPARAELRF